jgi:hypothetical protein
MINAKANHRFRVNFLTDIVYSGRGQVYTAGRGHLHCDSVLLL